MTQALFQDRRDAGHHLASHLSGYAGRKDVRVLALPRGGVPVGLEVARALRAPLDVFVVRKLGVPYHAELAMGAIAKGARVVNDEMVRSLGITPAALAQAIETEQAELDRRERVYREGQAPIEVRGACVILVDDGMATGATMRVALRALRAMAPARLVAAVPVAAEEACAGLRDEADEVVCAATPPDFAGVSRWYVDFSQTSDAQVLDCLARARQAA
jgi:predicted phosphoribosyltransferase